MERPTNRFEESVMADVKSCKFTCRPDVGATIGGNSPACQAAGCAGVWCFDPSWVFGVLIQAECLVRRQHYNENTFCTSGRFPSKCPGSFHLVGSPGLDWSQEFCIVSKPKRDPSELWKRVWTRLLLHRKLRQLLPHHPQHHHQRHHQHQQQQQRWQQQQQ